MWFSNRRMGDHQQSPQVWQGVRGSRLLDDIGFSCLPHTHRAAEQSDYALDPPCLLFHPASYA